MANIDIDYNVLFIIAGWVEAVAYGFLFCIFCVTLYFTFGGARRSHDSHSKILLGISTAMFLIATVHACLSCYRLVAAYVFNGTNPRGGPAGYLGNLGHWDAILTETLYSTQEILGGAAAIYRCWVLWNKQFKIVALPILLLIVTIVFGYWTDALFTRPGTLEGNIHDLVQLKIWIRTFYAVAVVQNILTTGLMIYVIYRNYRNTVGANVRSFGGIRMTWLMRTMVEAAALQLLVEFLLLILFSVGTNVQYIFLDSVVPVIGITFNAMTISYRMRLLTERSGDTMRTFKAAQQSDIEEGERTQTTRVGVEVDVIELSGTSSVYRAGKGKDNSFGEV
ncbi:hypothetical protein GYMLUDRAFT_46643 [Collybiopsis luxurians FD-317 M1]|uniref:Unplaced genomic scaffold GYMLUscaffold_45, whole genome shotgun sequence n=1 Tax=Collybiopsis luxurians FD-317 M1 TaxID=944289 RepID=A0A0D0BPP7_9AGAR|nr:hypothetical protein GYMLUDRAFT_46643 [Collybiopsis luxurians FD-317 M1]